MLKYKNLLVSGCSFTKDWGAGALRSWPHFVQQHYNFDTVINCALSGAGNKHIADSIVHQLEFNTELTPADTYVIVMWTGADRMDTLIADTYKNQFHNSDHYYYNDHIVTGTTGGIHRKQGVLGALYDVKNQDILALETFINITNTYHYLRSRGYKFKFLTWRNIKLPARDHAFDWQELLDPPVDVTYMFTDILTVYEYCLRMEYMSKDDYHPTAEGYQHWVDDVLCKELDYDLIN